MRIGWVLGPCLRVTLLWVTAYSVRRLRGLMGTDPGVFLHREIAEVCYRFVRGAEDTAGSIQHSLKKGDQTENHSHKNRVKDEKGLKKKITRSDLYIVPRP